MPRSLRLVFAALIVAVLVGGPLSYRRYREKQLRNFRVVEDGVLYRGGQFTLDSMKRVAAEHGIKTIVCLREGDATQDQQEEAWAKGAGLKFVRIAPLAWHGSGGPPPIEKGLRIFRGVMADPANHPVLIHCYAGIHRTGSYVAVHRMDRQGWSSREAMNEMRALGYDTLDDDRDVYSYLLHYRPEAPPVPSRIRPAVHTELEP